MAAKGVALATNSSASAATAPVNWPGGRAALITTATAYGTTVQLQLMGQNGNYINFGSTISADACTVYDLPAGQYRMNLAGTNTALYASLVGIPYT